MIYSLTCSFVRDILTEQLLGQTEPLYQTPSCTSTIWLPVSTMWVMYEVGTFLISYLVSSVINSSRSPSSQVCGQLRWQCGSFTKWALLFRGLGYWVFHLLTSLNEETCVLNPVFFYYFDWLEPMKS